MESNHLTTYWEREEEENSKKGLIGSICFHSILLLIFLLPWFSTADPPPGIPGVLVSMGNPEMLAAEEPSPQKSSEALAYQNEDDEQPEANNAEAPADQKDESKPTKVVKPSKSAAKPSKEVPAKFEKTVKDAQEESPIQIKVSKEKKNLESINELERKNAEAAKQEEEKLEKEKQEQIAKAKATAEAERQAEAAAKARAEAEAKRKQAEEAARKIQEEQKKKQAAYQKTKNELGSLFGGDGNNDQSEGKKGDPDGSKDSKILEGLSGGLGEVGGGLSGRGIVYEPEIKENSQKVGKVVVKVCVDKSGSVISSKFTQRGSTTTDSQLVDVAQKAAAKYKFTPGDLSEQCGTITIDFKLQ